MSANSEKRNRVSFGMFLVTIGIVYGDIGTSPLYVMKSIVAGNGGIGQINQDFIIGSLSLVIWTVTLLTTTKYVLIAMKADNHGEGGIFALFSLVRTHGKWLIIPAMLGGSALLADGVLTPAVTVTTAVEGLRSIEIMNRILGEGQWMVVVITLVIISALFAVQRAGTSKIGKAFGPCMLVWFSFLGVTGTVMMLQNPVVLKAFNPLYAVNVLISPYNKAGLMILGSVFLATTGAEALYSDMGHVGRENIYISWPFVKGCLILSYMGQGAWIINNMANTSLYSIQDLNPFFQMLPTMLRPVAVLLSAMAAIIASQALITGSFTLVSEAIKLDLMPHMDIRYPSDTKGQMYIGTINNLLWIGCSLMVLIFRSGHKIEAAYGLTITLTMLMDTLLISTYLRKIKIKNLLSWAVLALFGAIEAVFFFSSLGKFLHGGYFTVLLTLLILSIMIIWHRSTNIEKACRVNLRFRDYVEQLGAIRADESLPYCAQNLVYIAKNSDLELIDRDILYSILDKDPKRAKAYWFFSVHVLDEPRAVRYEVETFGTDYIFRVKLSVGFKNHQRLNVYIRQIVNQLLESGELPAQERKYSIYGPSDVGNFKFCFLRRTISAGTMASSFDEFVLSAKYAIREAVGSQVKWYGLETSSLIFEHVPLIIKQRRGQQDIPVRWHKDATAENTITP